MGQFEFPNPQSEMEHSVANTCTWFTDRRLEPTNPCRQQGLLVPATVTWGNPPTTLLDCTSSCAGTKPYYIPG